ncbi:hypothetical protein CC80DRAFT_519895 [Byssothecium circinans]|uniref:Uncharacterized protein n=1 Tax=Byssothecium circinans TaxID=147558 RepID=A0A6A5TCF4_9PLEO|nr:hypothetical protein CC80DRAFT_519895 [Byssothecium circinans]
MDSSLPSPLATKQHSDALLPGSSVPTTPDENAILDASYPKGPVSETLSSLLDPSLPQPFPLPAPPHAQELPTPLQEDRPDFNLSFAGLLPSTSVSLPTPPAVKTSHNLRLPSFDLLGIAAPHPDRTPLATQLSFSSLGGGPLSKPEDPLHVLSPKLHRIPQFDGPDEPFPPSPQAARAHIHHMVPIVTPPIDPGILNWGSFVNVRTAGLGSPPSSEPGVSPNLTSTADATAPGPSSNIVVPVVSEASEALGMAVWVPGIKEILTSESGCQKLTSVKILSHALPCPSMNGHLFGELIAYIHDESSTTTDWINVFHAVPGRFTLSDLPKSPPSTPGPAVGGDEYFTSRVYDSAVAIPDYQLDSKLLPPSPRPVVPPGSIQISVVERYIPPTNTNEYAEMFMLRGRSLLHDRLAELTTENGLLLFIYPTKTGARTFMQYYLGPVLDPLLRTLTVVHDLASDLGRSLGQMTSVAYLDEYDALKTHMENFCVKVGENAAGEKKPTYQVIHAAREEVYLERDAWAKDWWIKQEKPRIRDTITKYFRQTKKLPESGMTGTHLIEAVLDGVANRKIEGGARLKGIEIGVFVVKKTM